MTLVKWLTYFPMTTNGGTTKFITKFYWCNLQSCDQPEEHKCHLYEGTPEFVICTNQRFQTKNSLLVNYVFKLSYIWYFSNIHTLIIGNDYTVSKQNKSLWQNIHTGSMILLHTIPKLQNGILIYDFTPQCVFISCLLHVQYINSFFISIIWH